MAPNQALCIIYFDSIIGPNVFYCNRDLVKTIKNDEISRILEFNDEEGSFIYAFKEYQTINYTFYLSSSLARGGKEIIMISYFIRASAFKSQINDVFEYLQSKIPILIKFAKKLKALKHIPELLHKNKKVHLKDDVVSLGDTDFQDKFFSVFNSTFRKLSSIPELIQPRINQSVKKVFIFGAEKVGKNTFLQNIEKLQAEMQENDNLPTKIFQVIIDNLEILTEECTESGLNCEQCERNNRCIDNAEGFIVIFDASDKGSIIDAKERFKIIVSKFCQRRPLKKIPILLIGNKFKKFEDISPKVLRKAFNTMEVKQCAIDMKYFPMNLLKDKENGNLLNALRWLIKNMI
jgi:signal recognition particle receptor subunit beta